MTDPSTGLKSGFHPPKRTSAIGMYLFLASLFMLFSAGMVSYVLFRIRVSTNNPVGTIEIPQALWISTAIVIIASITIQTAVNKLRHERQPAFRMWLFITMALAIAFVIVQVPSLRILLLRHQEMRQKKVALYGLIFVLILLHALHVLGGIIALAWTSKRAAGGAYDHENYQPVGRVALYWHFLDVVWLVMFFTFQFVK